MTEREQGVSKAGERREGGGEGRGEGTAVARSQVISSLVLLFRAVMRLPSCCDLITSPVLRAPGPDGGEGRQGVLPRSGGGGAPGAQVQGRLRRGARGGDDCGGAGCSSGGGMVAARARAARAAEARAGHRSGGAYTKGSLVPLVWSRSQIWSPTLILDVIGISQHLPERDRALSAHLCRRCTPGASARLPRSPSAAIASAAVPEAFRRRCQS